MLNNMYIISVVINKCFLILCFFSESSLYKFSLIIFVTKYINIANTTTKIIYIKLLKTVVVHSDASSSVVNIKFKIKTVDKNNIPIKYITFFKLFFSNLFPIFCTINIILLPYFC